MAFCKQYLSYLLRQGKLHFDTIFINFLHSFSFSLVIHLSLSFILQKQVLDWFRPTPMLPDLPLLQKYVLLTNPHVELWPNNLLCEVLKENTHFNSFSR